MIARPVCGSVAELERHPRAVHGVLRDGTVFYVPRGAVWGGPAGICCHLCGFWFADLVPHLATGHGWTRDRYVAAFGLDRNRHLSASPQPQGGRPSWSGRSDRGAARSAPACRRENPRRTAAVVAARFGVDDLGEWVRAGVRSGLGLAELSRRAGLPDGWLDEHLADLSPATAAWVSAVRSGADPLGRSVAQRWLLGVAALGYGHPADYLRERRAAGWSWDRIAGEGGVSRSWLLERRDRIESLFDPVLGPCGSSGGPGAGQGLV